MKWNRIKVYECIGHIGCKSLMCLIFYDFSEGMECGIGFLDFLDVSGKGNTVNKNSVDDLVKNYNSLSE